MPLVEALRKLGRAEAADRVLAQVVERGMPREQALESLRLWQSMQKP